MTDQAQGADGAGTKTGDGIGTAIPLRALNIAEEQWGANWVANEVEGLAKFLQAAHVNGRLDVEPLSLDGGEFFEWSAADLAAHCRAQSRNMMDPEFARFLSAVADRLSAPSSPRTGQERTEEELLSALKDARDQLHELCRDNPGAAWLTDQLAEGEGLLAGINVVIAHAEATIAARPAAPEAQGAERVRHVKRGTEYEVLHRGVELQVSLTRSFCLGHLNLPALEEGHRLVIYQGADGKAWAREEDEFDDGRFEPAPPASSGQGGR